MRGCTESRSNLKLANGCGGSGCVLASSEVAKPILSPLGFRVVVVRGAFFVRAISPTSMQELAGDRLACKPAQYLAAAT